MHQLSNQNLIDQEQGNLLLFSYLASMRKEVITYDEMLAITKEIFADFIKEPIGYVEWENAFGSITLPMYDNK